MDSTRCLHGRLSFTRNANSSTCNFTHYQFYSF
uniref:Uncharacterized protein n=1 Tax=Rhizophora mucronata TaxID=61149 RepID=A0A2P2KSR6_RHIMU